MTQLTFITLFLGLILGPREVALNVTGPADHIELLIDGHQVAELRAPWKTTIDFGPQLLPHRLTARALNDRGEEVARAEQTLNVPRASAEVQLVLQRDESGAPSSVQVLWQSLEADRPKAISLTLDGASLALDANLRAQISSIDNTRPHLLRGRVVSPSGMAAETEVAFGGGLESQSGRHLTAVPIRLLDRKRTLTAEQLERWLMVRGERARVVAVEEMPGDVIIVRHPSVDEAWRRLDPSHLNPRRPYAIPQSEGAVRHPRPIARFVWPIGRRTATSTPTDLMPLTSPFEFSSSDDFQALLTRVSYGTDATHPRYADAVAVAGIQAMSLRRACAVVLVTGADRRDESRLRAADARTYLRSIAVPLFVWSLTPLDGPSAWGDVFDISEPHLFRRAFAALRETLQSQRIVWIDGDYLPTEIELAPAAAGTIETNGLM